MSKLELVAWWFPIILILFTILIVLPVFIVKKSDRFEKQCELANGVTVMPYKSRPICLAKSAVIEIRSE